MQPDVTQRVGRALAWTGLAFVLAFALGAGSVVMFPKSPVTQLALFTLVTWAAIVVARPGWPALWRVLLAYGLAARIPVLIVMFLAIFQDWDSHYAKPRPDFPPMGHGGLFFWTAFLPQMSLWIFLTIAGGILFGAIALGVRRLAGGDAGEGAPRAPASAGA